MAVDPCTACGRDSAVHPFAALCSRSTNACCAGPVHVCLHLLSVWGVQCATLDTTMGLQYLPSQRFVAAVQWMFLGPPHYINP